MYRRAKGAEALDWTRKVKAYRRLFGSLLVVLAAALAAGCGGSWGGKQLTLGYLGWDENVANSNLLKVLFEEELDYNRVELKLVGLGSAFEGVAGGELDAFTDVWMPNHRTLLEGVEDRVELSREPWYLGRTEFGLAVPHYMEDTRSIADLDEAEVDMIFGIEPGAVLMKRLAREVIPEYGLDISLVEASTPAMLAEVAKAYRYREPIVFVAWSPHWMNAEYDFHYLEDPKDAIGRLDEPSELHSIVRNGLKEEDPAAYTLINAMKLDEDQIYTLQLAVNEAGSPEEGVHEWLETRENREAVRPWIEAAREA